MYVNHRERSCCRIIPEPRVSWQCITRRRVLDWSSSGGTAQQLDNAADRRSRGSKISISGPIFDRWARRTGDEAHVAWDGRRRRESERAGSYSRTKECEGKTARDVEGFKKIS